MRAQAAYDELIQRTREEALLSSCADLLAWDEETYMPRAGVAHRASQLALLAGILHGKGTDPRIGELLAAVEGSPLVADPLSPAAVNVREIRRIYNRAVRLPRSLVEELARQTSFAQQEWSAAREENNFAHFRPWLEKIVHLKVREAECLGYGDSPYDALLEDYEPGLTSAEVARLFDALRRELVPLVTAITYSRRKANVALLRREFPTDRQRIFGEAVAAAVGFDFERGRLDRAAHPFFCTIGPGDFRVTTRYDARRFGTGFFTILHEVGHGLYEQGLDPEHHGTPMGEAMSLALHESQARLWENTVGRSGAFWRYFFPWARQIFPGVLGRVGLEEFHFAINHVEPGPVRVQADEVTYNLHILVRFEVEQSLVAGNLKPADLPAAWNQAYQHYLGVTPASDAEGCLQDGHWAAGLVGYFPTYTLGNLFAAQLFEKTEKELGSLEEPFTRGEFGGLLDWLREKVYRQGSRYPARHLIEVVTGSPPNHRPLIDAMQRKYTELYGL